MMASSMLPAAPLTPIESASLDSRHLGIMHATTTSAAPHNPQSCGSHEATKVFGIAVQASISGAEEDSRGSELSSKAFCISAVTASKARSMYELGTSVAGTSVDSHRIFVNGGFQTELELSSQDQAAEPPDTAYASIMPCTAP